MINGFRVTDNYGVAKNRYAIFLLFVRSFFLVGRRENKDAEVVHGHGYVIQSKKAHLGGRGRDDERGGVVDLIKGEQSANDGKEVGKRGKQRQTTIKKPDGGGDQQNDGKNTDKTCHADRDVRVPESDVMGVFCKTARYGQSDDPGNEYERGQDQKDDPYRLCKADLFQRKDFGEGKGEHIQQNAK